MRINRQVFAAVALAGVLALVGCGGSSDSGSKSDSGKEEAAQEQTAEPEAAPEAAPEPEPEPEPAAPETDFPTTIDAVRLGEDYEGNPAAIITFTWTNNSDDTTSFAASVHPEVFQNGVQCDVAIVMDINNDKYLSDVRPGGTVTVELGYELEDTSDIEVEVGELFSFSDDLIASGTYSLQ